MHRIIINAILLVIFLIMSYSLYKVLNGRALEEGNVEKIRQLYNAEISLNKNLSDQYKYYNSSEYIEKISRDNLNLAPAGEYLVVLPDDGYKLDTSSNQAKRINSRSNFSKWIDQFLN